MNRILLGTSLLLAAGLCGQAAQAAPNYTASATIVSPTGTYTAYYPNLTYQVPLSVTNQYVDVSGAAPSSTISISWGMRDAETDINFLLASDSSNGPTVVPTDIAGHYRHYVNGNSTGSVSYTVQIQANGQTQSFFAYSVITDTNGQSYSRTQGTTFTVDEAT